MNYNLLELRKRYSSQSCTKQGVLVSRPGYLVVSLKFSPDQPLFHGNEFWRKKIAVTRHM